MEAVDFGPAAPPLVRVVRHQEAVAVRVLGWVVLVCLWMDKRGGMGSV